MVRGIALRSLAIALGLSMFLLAFQAQAQSIRVSVNGEAITDQQINQRAQLLALEGRGASNSARTQTATEELIEEMLKLAEAQRLGISVTESQVDNAISSIATNMRVSVSNLNTIMNQNGVNINTLRNRLRAAIAWQSVVQQAISPRVQISELELELQAAQMVEETSSIDYILKEVLFVIAQGSGASASRRTAEANQYRNRFTGCDTAVDLVLEFNDAAVRDIGRRHATQMSDAMATELASLTVGQLTRPRVVENGVSMYAVCEKTAARDLTFLTQELRQEAGTEALQEEAAAYLERLKANAAIIRR